MANIALIKVLRERTQAGMMDCKKALEACNDDVDAACDYLREKGIVKAAKKADRIAAEGLTTVKVSGNKAVIVEVNSETDFVAKSDPFIELVSKVADTLLANTYASFEDAKAAVEPLFIDATVKLGEKLSFRRYEIVEGDFLDSYIHGHGKISVCVSLKADNPELAHGLAMHIAANAPKYVNTASVPANVIEAERAVQLEACKNDEKLANKPEKVLAGIIQGKVNKVLAEVTLSEQAYLLNPELTVKQALADAHNEIISFTRYQVGEGLEKRVDDFAAEVMAQAK